jgi:cytoskeleton protein RodZ
MMEALNVEPVQPTQLVSRTHTPKAQWWAEQIGRRLVYIVLTLSLAIPAWVATRQHLNGTPATVASLDTPVAAVAAGKPPAAVAPRTVVASMAPMPAMATPTQPAAAAELVLQATGQSWLEVVARDGSVLEKTMLQEGAEKRFPMAQVQRLTIGNAAVVQMTADGQPLNVTAHARANVARFAVSSDGSLTAQD